MAQKKTYRLILILIGILTGYLSATAQSSQVIDTIVVPAANARVYRVVPEPGIKYFWIIDCGTMLSPNGLDSIKVKWCNNPGMHTIKVVESTIYGCMNDTMVAKVKVTGDLIVSIAGAKDICEGETVVLSAYGASTYLWNTGATDSQIVVQPVTTTTYSVVGYLGALSDTAQTVVNVHPRPKANFTYSPDNPDVNQLISFYFTGQGDKIKWYFDSSGVGDTTLDAEHSFDSVGTKTVTLVVTNKTGCTDKITMKVFIQEKTYIFVPTAFTPNGDGLNDVFKVVSNDIISLQMQVYNRWGEQIFVSNDQNQGWDGTFRGVPVEDGVYLYLIQAQTNDLRWHYLSGNVTLVR